MTWAGRQRGERWAKRSSLWLSRRDGAAAGSRVRPVEGFEWTTMDPRGRRGASERVQAGCPEMSTSAYALGASGGGI